jgi:hypothetical protein
MGFGLTVGFCPVQGRICHFLALAPWRFFSLGCRTAEFAVTLDTRRRVHQLRYLNKGTVVLSVFRAGRVYVTSANPFGVD